MRSSLQRWINLWMWETVSCRYERKSSALWIYLSEKINIKKNLIVICETRLYTLIIQRFFRKTSVCANVFALFLNTSSLYDMIQPTQI